MYVGGSERVVVNPLGIEVGASDSGNMKTFKRINAATGVVTYEAVVVWFEVLAGTDQFRTAWFWRRFSYS